MPTANVPLVRPDMSLNWGTKPIRGGPDPSQLDFCLAELRCVQTITTKGQTNKCLAARVF